MQRLADRSGDCAAAIVYALLDDRGEPVYIGSTTKGTGERVRKHRSNRRWTPNATLAAFLAKGEPEFRELAVVPDAERFDREREISLRMRRRHKLLNLRDGYAHSPESRRRISQGMRAYHARRGSPAA